MKTCICSLVVTILASSACGPTAPRQDPPLPTMYTISGTVTEMAPSGPTPVEGVLLQFDFGMQTMTDDHGSYALAFPPTRPETTNRRVTASKAGYTAAVTIEGRHATPGDPIMALPR